MIEMYAEPIAGCCVGLELVSGEDIYEDEPGYYLAIDLLVFRVLIYWMKGS